MDKEASMLGIHTILHPTDFSERSQAAFSVACALARDYGAKLIVMHAIPRGTVEILALSQLGMQQGNIQKSFVNELKSIQSPDFSVQIEHRLEIGSPSHCILNVAKETQCDLIVMGSHGHSALGRLLTGSVADAVQHKATCPVLIVRLPFHGAHTQHQAQAVTALSAMSHDRS